MEQKSQGKLPTASSTPFAAEEDQLARCLEALDKGGEPALQKELDRLYSPTDLERVPLLANSHALMIRKKASSVPKPNGKAQ